MISQLKAKIILAMCLGSAVAFPVQALDLKNTMSIRLIPSSGPAFELGEIHLTPIETGYRYAIKMDTEKFGDHFLSMREFKCFEHPKQMLCHVVYPYDKPQTISEGHLTNLEYDLMFIHRKSTDYGINLWNGVYYKLEAQGNKLVGSIRELDMNILAAPPEAGIMYPITDDDLHAGSPENHAYPTLVIE